MVPANRLLAVLVAAAAGCTTISYGEDEHFPVDCAAFPRVGPAGALLVTNSMSDTVSWIDLGTDTVMFEEPIGRIGAEREGPHHGAASPDGRYYYVGLSNFVPGSGGGPHGQHGTGTVPGWALKYDACTHQLVGAHEVDRNPGDLRLTPDGALLLQSHFDLVKIAEATMNPDWRLEDTYAPLAIIDTATMTPRFVDVCPAPHGIAMSADGATVYLACYASDELAIVDLASEQVTRVPLGAAPASPTSPQIQPYAVAQSPADDSLWVTCPTANADPFGTIRVYDPGAGAWRDPPITTIGKPFFPTFSADGARLYVPEQPNLLTVRDGATGALVDQVSFAADECVQPHAVWVTTDGAKAYVVCEGDHPPIDPSPGTVAVVDLTAQPPAVATVITVGVFPDDVVFIPAAAAP